MSKAKLAALAIFGIIVISVLATIDPTIFSFIRGIPAGDKIAHFVLFGIATLAVTSALTGARSFLWGGLIVMVLVLAEEFTQLYFATRSFSYTDLLASTLGVLSASIFCYFRADQNAT